MDTMKKVMEKIITNASFYREKRRHAKKIYRTMGWN